MLGTVSVVVPIYNVEKYLLKCVRSIQEQTYSDLEIILVDDGSPDGCPAMCEDLKCEDSRIRVIHKENGGLSDARNAGIEVAGGDYITFVDSDDYIAPDFIQSMMSVLEDDIDIVCGGYERVTDKEEVLETRMAKEPRVLNNHDAMLEMVKNREIRTTAWGKVFRRNLFDDIRFDKGKYHEDIYIMHKLFGKARKVAVVSVALYSYRVNQNSITGSSFSPKHEDAVYAHLERMKFLKERYPDLADDEIEFIVWHCCDINWRIMKSGREYKEFILYNNQYIRKYLRKFLKCEVSLKTKGFALFSLSVLSVYGKMRRNNK